jgi:predicted unusual protein kinase regulating ubiquinone biosynthesis (AarF/ABC1/UbiB family)
VLVREFANSLGRETDFNREARSIVLFRTALANVPDLWIPDIRVVLICGRILLKIELKSTRLYPYQYNKHMCKISAEDYDFQQDPRALRQFNSF